MTDCDVLVIGAGIHGAGVAQAAAAAGHTVVVIERSAPAAGTSSKSSKLIHGGLRYLETAQLTLVRESLAERRRLLRVAPSLVRLVDMHIPVYGGMQRSPLTIRAGLSAYAMLGRLDRNARFRALPRRAWGSLDGLDTHGLKAVFRYHEAQTDDAALTRAVLDSAVALGALVRVPAEVTHAQPHDDGVSVTVRDGGSETTIHALALVNAAGPWAPGVARRIVGVPAPPAVELVQGTHVEFDGALTEGAYYVEAPADARAVFVMPYRGRTLVGTTERLYTGDPAEVAPTADEVAYLTDTYRRHFPHRVADVRASWAGLRVLPAAATTAFNRPRETVFDRPHPRVLGIYGGKLTTWRPTAAAVMRRLGQVLPRRAAKADPDGIRLG